jgi:hypothetical protein
MAKTTATVIAREEWSHIDQTTQNHYIEKRDILQNRWKSENQVRKLDEKKEIA